MFKNKKLSKLFIIASLFVLASLVLSACGGSPAPAPTTAPVLGADQPTAAPADQATAAPTTDQSGAAAPTADQSGAATTAPAAGGSAYLADLGFRPDVNGFPFQNYGPGYTDLTPAEMEQVFGAKVCANGTGSTCTLIPPADQLMQQFNKQMSGGHCYGFSVASLLFYSGALKAQDYGSDSITNLSLQGSPLLQRTLAKEFITQFFSQVQQKTIQGSPSEILDALIAALKPGAAETYTIGIFKRDKSGGHAITPYAVQDRGNGVFAILVYDNNYPKEAREMKIDRNANTWSYEASINPSVQPDLYEGDATTKSMQLMPTTPGQVQLPCDFCANGGQSSTPKTGGNFNVSYPAQASTATYQIFLDGANPDNHAHLLFTDKNGKNFGYKDGKFVEEIPGMRADFALSAAKMDTVSPEPIYYIPTNTAFTMTIDGSALKEADSTDVVIIGQGFYIGVYNVMLDPGAKDTLEMTNSGDGMKYTTEYAEAPTIVVGFDGVGSEPDFEFSGTGVDIDPGSSIIAAWDKTQKAVAFGTSNTKLAGKFDFEMSRIDDKTETYFKHSNLELGANDVLYFFYDSWTATTPLQANIDHGGTGTNLEKITLENETP